MDGLVAELGGGGGTRCSALRAGPQQLRLQLNDPLFERLAFHSSGRRRDRDDLVGDHLLHRHVRAVVAISDIESSQNIPQLLGLRRIQRDMPTEGHLYTTCQCQSPHIARSPRPRLSF